MTPEQSTLLSAIIAVVVPLVTLFFTGRAQSRKINAEAKETEAKAKETEAKAKKGDADALATIGNVWEQYAERLEPRIQMLESKLDEARETQMKMSKELAASYVEINELKRELDRVLNELEAERHDRLNERAERDKEIEEWRVRYDRLQERVGGRTGAVRASTA